MAGAGIRTEELGARFALAGIVGSALLATIPVPRSWDVYATRYAGLMACAAIWSLAAAFGGLRRPTKRDAWWIGSWLALAVVAVVSSWASYAPAEMLTYGSGYYMGASSWVALAACAIGASLVRADARFRTALRWTVAPVVLVALAAVGEAVAGHVVRAGFDNSNHLVPGLLLGAGVALAASHGEASRGVRIALRVAAAVMAAAVVVSGSLAGVLAAAFGGALVLALAPSVAGVSEGWSRRAAKAAIAALCVLVLAAAAVAAGFVPRGLAERFIGTSASSRLELWRIAVRSVADKPLLGTGADTYEIAAQRYMGDSEGARALLMAAVEQGPIAEDPHDLPLRLLAEFGVIGLAAGGAVAGSWLRRSGLLGGGSPARKALSVAVAAWALALLLLPLSVEWGAWPAVVAGCAIATSGEGAVPSRRSRAVVGTAGVLAAAAALYFAAAAVLGAWHMARAQVLPDNRSVLQEVQRAVAVQPGMGYYRFVELDIRGRLLDGSPEALRAYQQAVDAAGPYVLEDARYMAMLVRNSLDDAYLTGRTDLGWESRHVARIARMGPRLPEVRMEVAHLALLSGDLGVANDALLAVRPFAHRLKRFGLYRYYYAKFAGLEQFVEQARREAAVDAEIERLLDGPPRR